MNDGVSDDVTSSLTRLAREESGRLVALLAHRFGDIDLADDAVQDALVEAARTWPARGIPSNPAAWLHTVARRCAIDRLRRAASAARAATRATDGIRTELSGQPDWRADQERREQMISETPDVGDEHLRLMLLCCHPALDPDAQVALTLRLVGGLTTDEVASAFLIPEPTLAQRIVRAKRKIRDARIPLTIPDPVTERLDAVLRTLYLIFNEGYLSRGTNELAMRVDLVDEAIRLTAVLDRLLPGQAEVEGLLALELFNRARLAARLDDAGELILLEDQDRSTWDLAAIGTANAVLARAMGRMAPGPYQLQAIIAAHHANARTAADTDWPAIVALYGQLSVMTPSPVIALNHAVSIAMADGPLAGLKALDALAGLDRYHLFHAARAELLLRSGDAPQAIEGFARARALTNNQAEQRHLSRRIAAATSAAATPRPEPPGSSSTPGWPS